MSENVKCWDCYQFARLESLEPREPELGGMRHRAGTGCRKDDEPAARKFIVGKGRQSFSRISIGVGTPVREIDQDGEPMSNAAWFYDANVAQEFVDAWDRVAQLTADLERTQAQLDRVAGHRDKLRQAALMAKDHQDRKVQNELTAAISDWIPRPKKPNVIAQALADQFVDDLTETLDDDPAAWIRWIGYILESLDSRTRDDQGFIIALEFLAGAMKTRQAGGQW